MNNSILKTKFSAILHPFLSFLASYFKRIRLKYIFLFFIIQILVAAVGFLIFGLLPVHKEVKRISSIVDSTSVKTYSSLTDDEKAIYNDLLKTKRDEEYLISEIQLSKSDSIYLVVNLNDSIARLMVKGIPLHESKIQKFRINNGLSKIPEYLYSQIFHKPLHSNIDYSTIEKFPIVLKVAPKDTLEAQQSEKAPVAPAIIDVFYSFEFEKNLTIEVKQHEADFVGPKKFVRQYNALKRKKDIQKTINFLTGKDDEKYSYRIEIEILREDARAIYRALPVKPYILIRYR